MIDRVINPDSCANGWRASSLGPLERFDPVSDPCPGRARSAMKMGETLK